MAVGDGWRKAAEVPVVFASRDRNRAALVAPTNGLTLARAVYGHERDHRLWLA